MDSKTTESIRNKIMSEFNEMQSNLQQDMSQKRSLHQQELMVRLGLGYFDKQIIVQLQKNIAINS